VRARDKAMKMSSVYLLLCIVGTVLSWCFLAFFLASGGASPRTFVLSIFSTPVASAVAADLFASAVLFLMFVFAEGRRMGMRGLWVYVPATLLVGLAFGAGLFFYRRASLIEARGS
jgi:hypothetical protein